jgi:hypothetical protein
MHTVEISKRHNGAFRINWNVAVTMNDAHGQSPLSRNTPAKVARSEAHRETIRSKIRI